MKFKKYINYLFFGGMTTLLSLLGFYLFIRIHFEYRVANVCSFIIAVTFAFFMNKFYVFEKKSESLREAFREAFHFLLARIGSFILDFFSLIVCVEYMHFDEMISKTVITIVVIILNYAVSEFIIFRKHEN